MSGKIIGPIAFDIETMKVACPIMQVVYGGWRDLTDGFDISCWETAPTDSMELYNVTEDQLAQLIKKSEDTHINNQLEKM